MGFGDKLEGKAERDYCASGLCTTVGTRNPQHSEDGSITVNQYYGSNKAKTRLQEYDVVLSHME